MWWDDLASENTLLSLVDWFAWILEEMRLIGWFFCSYSYAIEFIDFFSWDGNVKLMASFGMSRVRYFAIQNSNGKDEFVKFIDWNIGEHFDLI